MTEKKPIMNKYDEDLPVEILHHSAYLGHKFKLIKDAGGVVPFLCDGCNEPGDGPRYTSDSGTRLHTSCGLAGEESHATLQHHLFPGKKFVFRHKPPPPIEGTICDACGEPALGFVYHCLQESLDLHPCCASLQPTITIQGEGGHATFELCNKASHRCAFCGDKGRRSRFWAYRGHNGGSYVYLHVACVKEKARLVWNEAYHNRVGSGGGIVPACRPAMEAAVRQSAPSSSRIGHFQKIIITVAKIIVAVIFGNPFAMISALVGPDGFFGG